MFLVKISLACGLFCLASGAVSIGSHTLPIPSCLLIACPIGQLCRNGHCVPDYPTIYPPICQLTCRNGKVCRQNKCVCLDGNIEINGRCYPPYPCGRPCPPGKVCKNGECVCKKGHDHRGRCVVCPPPRIYRRCPTNCPRTCEHDPDDPISCTKECNLNRYCICPPGYVEKSKTDSTCVKEERCPNKCHGVKCPPDSRCVLGKCICTRRCPPNQHCVDGECVCLPGYFLNEGRCIDDCRRCPRHSTCRKGKCFCKEGYFMNNGKCDDKCILMKCGGKYQTCKEGECICIDGYTMVDGECVSKCPRPKILKLCPNACSVNCDNKDNPPICPAICRPGFQCVCPNGYIERSRTDSDCVKPSQCPDDCRRCPRHSTCNRKEKCVCKEGYFMNDGKCDDKCIFMKCGGKYQTCKEGECICIDDYTMVDGECVSKCPQPKIFNSCPTACPVNCDNKDNPPKLCIAVCRPGVQCVCNRGYIERSATNFDCIQPHQCPDDCDRCPAHSTCRKGKCFCKKGYFMNNGKCADACIVTDCREGRICRLGRCLCPDGSEEIGGECNHLCALIYCGRGKTCRNGICVNLCGGYVCEPYQK